MTEQEMKNLNRGDIVFHIGSGNSYVVIETYPQIIAIRHVTIANPSEWVLSTSRTREETDRTQGRVA